MVIALWIVGILASLLGGAAVWFSVGTPAGGGNYGADILATLSALIALTLALVWLVLMVIHLWPTGV